MLTRLRITNFLLIEQLELDFFAGLTVVTGETGSGKSIIIDALMLVFGARAAKDIIRNTEKLASFEAEFTLASSNSNVIAWLGKHDLLDIDNQQSVICRRVIDYQGKNKAYINGHAVTAAQIKSLGDYILDIHTQHASVTLLKTDTQRNLLDQYAGVSDKSQKLATLFKIINDTTLKLEQALSHHRELEFKRQILIESINELSTLNLQANEWEELNAKHKQLANAENILTELAVVEEALQGRQHDESGGAASIIQQINQINSRLGRIATHEPNTINELINLLNSAEIELKECCYSISAFVSSIDQGLEHLPTLEARINQIFDISRKHRISPEQIVERLEEWRQELDLLTQDSDISALKQKLLELESKYNELAPQISAARVKYAQELGSKVTAYLHQLAISGEFRVELVPLSESSSYGLENVEYKVCFNKGLPLQLLAKAASGGELSRTALALYLLLSINNAPEIIIFDEIDVGIGGKIAAKVGELLRVLGQAKQVICITHQPQTASCGNHHLVVSKYDEQHATVTKVQYVKDGARINEIARMLGGAKITPTTLSHAQEMLAELNKS